MGEWDLGSGSGSSGPAVLLNDSTLQTMAGPLAATGFQTLGNVSAAGVSASVVSPAEIELTPTPTASAPSYAMGGLYFDSTLNKLRVGGVSGWETVTSA